MFYTEGQESFHLSAILPIRWGGWGQDCLLAPPPQLSFSFLPVSLLPPYCSIALPMLKPPLRDVSLLASSVNQSLSRINDPTKHVAIIWRSIQ